MQVYSAIIRDGEPYISDPKRIYRDDGHGPILEIFEVLHTASGKQAGTYIGSCYANTLVTHRELARVRGVKIGGAYLAPKTAVELVDSVEVTLRGVGAPEVSRLDERVRNYEKAGSLPRSTSAIRKPNGKAGEEPKIETKCEKFERKTKSFAKNIQTATKFIGGLCEEITSVGIRVSGPRL